MASYRGLLRCTGREWICVRGISKHAGQRGLYISVYTPKGYMVEKHNVTYQKQLPYSLRSSSLACLFTVVKALPVAFLWYVFFEGSPPWLVSVIFCLLKSDDIDRTDVGWRLRRRVKTKKEELRWRLVESGMEAGDNPWKLGEIECRNLKIEDIKDSKNGGDAW